MTGLISGVIAGVMEGVVIAGAWVKYGVISPGKDDKKQWMPVIAMGILAVLQTVLLFRQDYGISTLLNQIMVSVILAVLAGIDYKKKVIPNAVLGIGFIFRAVLLAYGWIAGPKEAMGRVFMDTAAGFAFGLLFLLLLSFITKHGIGYGDVKMFAWLGFCLGLADTYYILFYSVFAAAAAGVYLLLVKKAEKKMEMPFAPFVYAGCYLVFGMAFLQG